MLGYNFDQIRLLSREYSFKVVIVPIPYLSLENDQQWQLAYQIISHEAEKYGFDVVETYSEMKDAGFSKLTIHPHDLVHPNKQGHLIIAEKLRDYIVARYQNRSGR